MQDDAEARLNKLADFQFSMIEHAMKCQDSIELLVLDSFMLSSFRQENCLLHV